MEKEATSDNLSLAQNGADPKDLFSSDPSAINSSIFSIDSLDDMHINYDSLKDILVEMLSGILKDEFRMSPRKQNIRVGRNELNFACPFCGDSMSDENKKRAHITLNGKFQGFFKCYNCGKFTTISHFFKCFNKQLSLSVSSALSNLYAGSAFDASTKAMSATTASVISQTEIDKYCIKREDIAKAFGLREIHDKIDDIGASYLKGRSQFQNVSKFMLDEKNLQLAILNLTSNGLVAGLQMRDLTGKRNAKYLTYTLSKLHDDFIKDGIKVPETFDALSNVFNIFTVDISNPIIVTEGPMDAFLLPNAIALSGANKNLPLRFKFMYLFDDDITGRNKSIEKLNHSIPVFMWTRLKKDYNLPQRKKWDVNDVINLLSTRKYNNAYPNWLKYFSDDPLDVLDL